MSESLVDGGIYIIRNLNSGLVLDVANGLNKDGANIQQWDQNGYNAQYFKVVALGDGYYNLYSVCTNNTKVIDLPYAQTANGTNIQLWSKNGHDAQAFLIKENELGGYTIFAKLNTSMCLGVANASSSIGANVALYTYSGNASQRWSFELVG